jgi:DNA processing protein
MKIFGLDEHMVRAAARAVRGGDSGGDAGGDSRGGDSPGGDTEATAAAVADRSSDDSDDGTEPFARAAWSTIAEPGDGTAGLVVGCLGAADALIAVIEHWTPAHLVEVLRERTSGGEAALGDDVPPSIEQALQRWTPRLKSRDVVLCLRLAERVGARLLLPADPLWPSDLDDLGAHAPLALWWRGIPAALSALSRSVSLVGARAATGYGEHVAMEASAGLVDRGFAIVSGAAYGIDGMAHRAALASQGFTVAFLAGGVDRFYPSGHDALLARIAESGAVVSELPCGAAPTKWRFLQRNRLIAAAGEATVVLEAGWRSGSLNTAGHAAALGRPLGAVPGPVTSPTSAGCHRLIREYDAVCVTSAAEMAELVGHEGRGQKRGQVRGQEQGHTYGAADDGGGETLNSVHEAPGGGRTSDQIRVIDSLSARSPRSMTDVARRAGLATTAVLGALGALELEGAVRERETGWVRGGA